jgi:hypothetical protein
MSAVESSAAAAVPDAKPAAPQTSLERAGARAAEVVEAPLQDLAVRLASVKEVQVALGAALREELAAIGPSGAPADHPVTVGDVTAQLKAKLAQCADFEGRLRKVLAAVGSLEAKLGKVEQSTRALKAKASARAEALRETKRAERERDRDLAGAGEEPEESAAAEPVDP